jgi:hypothetical protein
LPIGLVFRIIFSWILQTKVPRNYRLLDKVGTLAWLPEPNSRRGRKIQTQVHIINSNSRTSNCQCSLFSMKNLIIPIFCEFGCLAVPVNPDMWSSNVI